MREETLSAQLGRLLDRLTPPRGIAGNADAQNAEVQSLLGTLLRHAPAKGYEAWWPEFESRLLEAHQTRAWPTSNEIAKACQSRVKGDVDEEAVKRAQQNLAIEWFMSKRKPHPVFNRPEITQEIIDRGMVSDIREARWIGLDLTKEQNEAAKEMRAGKDEWDHHVRVSARLSGRSFFDEESHQIQTLAPHTLPEHVAHRRTQDAAE